MSSSSSSSSPVEMVVEGEDEPVSPTGQYFNSSVLSVCILAVFESEVPIDDSPAMAVLENVFLPISPRFSSVMVRDQHGVQHWRRVKVKVEDHVFVPIFPPNLSLQSYEERVQGYISQVSIDPFPQSRPLWEMHIVKYPTTSSGGTVVFKLHHALGDGFSLMGALFSCLQRADNPTLPLTFPRSHRKLPTATTTTTTINIGGAIPRLMSTWFNTARDFLWGLLKSNFVQDHCSPIRSMTPGLEFRPVTIASLMFSLESIHQIKAKLGGTVNDVLVGIIFYGIQLYIEKISGGGGGAGCSFHDLTALVLLNTRSINGYQTLKEMTDPNTESPWGNQFGFLHVPIPMLEDAPPLDFVAKTKEVIRRKRTSVAVHLNGKLLQMLTRFKGSEAAAQYIHKTLRSTSMTISNLIGPMEKMRIAGHPVGSFYFMVVGVPQSLTITAVSYMGKLNVALGTEKGFINSQLLVSCMEKAFGRILEEAVIN